MSPLGHIRERCGESCQIYGIKAFENRQLFLMGRIWKSPNAIKLKHLNPVFHRETGGFPLLWNHFLLEPHKDSEVDMTNENNRSAVSMGDENKTYYYILVNSSDTKSIKVKPGTYSCTGSFWRYLTDSNGNSYYPVTDPMSFTVKSGETTTITVKLNQDY